MGWFRIIMNHYYSKRCPPVPWMSIDEYNKVQLSVIRRAGISYKRKDRKTYKKVEKEEAPSGFLLWVSKGCQVQGHVMPGCMTGDVRERHWHLTPLSQIGVRCAIESTSQMLIILGNGAAESAALTEVITP